ncbi:ATP-dependent helicase [Leucobacter chinensis]|uniref:ATP-dependent helicase n=1 Tax=Leucobacter chinensis TaxID=2851010 RepID=UPI001C24DD9B|nr:ATP-dependent helicase [Leucobacter chinensis]
MTVPTPEAEEAKLDADQQRAVYALRGPVVIHAGAGAGKTRTITHRIAHGVHTGTYAPSNVMAVTFTRKAALELQQRLHELGVQGVQTRTFHSAAMSQLGYFWPRVVGGQSPNIIDGKARLIGQIAASEGMRLRGETMKDLAAEIEWRKSSMLNLERYGEIVGDRGGIGELPPERVLWFHERYEALKDDRRQIDFEDALILMTGMLEQEPNVALEVRQQYRFFTVDEYQDISPLQHALMHAWLGERTDLCVVGDASQTIYSFAGATSKYLLGFESEFPGATKLQLEQNYRSTAPIVTAANTLMHGQPGALRLVAARTDDGPAPSFEWFGSEKDEAEAVAQAIRERVASGTPASDIAVLYRSHGYSVHLEEALARNEVHARSLGAQRFFDRADVKRAVMEIRAQAVAKDTRPVFQVVSDVLRTQGWTSAPPARGEGGRERWEVLNALLKLVDELPEGTSLGAFSEELLRRSKAHHEPSVNAVTLSTVHAAKGLEWPVVWLAGAAEGVFPISYAKDERTLEEERRLFYVATTRARDALYVSGAGGGKRTPSRFIELAGIAQTRR